MDKSALFTSKSDEWYTPQYLFDALDKEFHFNLDPCATDASHKCDYYFTKEEDGLQMAWGGTECFAIRHILKLINGLKKHTGKREQITRLSFCWFPQGLIQNTFTISFISVQKFGLSKAD